MTADHDDRYTIQLDDTDEVFLVLEGELLLDFEDRESVSLKPHQGYTVPKGVVHRTRAPVRTAILMVEAEGGCAHGRLSAVA